MIENSFPSSRILQCYESVPCLCSKSPLSFCFWKSGLVAAAVAEVAGRKDPAAPAGDRDSRCGPRGGRMGGLEILAVAGVGAAEATRMGGGSPGAANSHRA